ncbi:T9SS type A sorting domain-containing protein [candidate division KSB1 bacterium]
MHTKKVLLLFKCFSILFFAGLIVAGYGKHSNGQELNSELKIVYTSYDRKIYTGDLYIINSDGTGMKNITHHPKYWKAAFQPGISPDGQKIVYSAKGETQTQSTNLYIIDINGENRRRITELNSGTYARPSFLNSTDKILFNLISDVTGFICTIDLNTSEYEWLTGIFDYDPDISPDGSKIVFSRDIIGPDSSICVLTLGDTVTQLTDTDKSYTFPSWSPDGSEIAYIARVADYGENNFEIFIMNADGSNQRRITYTELAEGGVTWSPDGSRLAYHYGSWLSSEYDIFTMKPDGSDVFQVTNNDARNSYPRWYVETATGVVEEHGIPLDYEVSYNYPNPFNSNTTIAFYLGMPGRIILRIYSITGKEVKIIDKGIHAAGYINVNWNGSGYPSGVYFYRIEVDNREISSGSMMLIK